MSDGFAACWQGRSVGCLKDKYLQRHTATSRYGAEISIPTRRFDVLFLGEAPGTRGETRDDWEKGGKGARKNGVFHGFPLFRFSLVTWLTWLDKSLACCFCA